MQKVKINRTDYICEIPNIVQREIFRDLVKAHEWKADSGFIDNKRVAELVNDGMNSRLCDLEKVVNIDKCLQEDVITKILEGEL